MIKQNLVDYTKQNIQQGYDTKTIQKALLDQGYPAADVNDSITAATGKKVEMPKSQSAPINQSNIQYGGFWYRLSAAMWDGIILGIPFYIINLIFAFGASLAGVPSLAYLVSLFYIVVYIYFEGVKGGTPGKLILGLRIQNEQGNVIGIPGAILRYIGKIVSALTLGIGYLMIAWDGRKQGLHDKLASTFVIHKSGVDRRGLYIVGLVLAVILPIIVLIVIFVLIFAFAGRMGVFAPQIVS